LTCQIHDGPYVLEGRTAAISDVERARLAHVPDLQVGEVQLDGAGPRRHVDEKVMLAGDERARPRSVQAFLARARLLVVRLRIEETADLELPLGHPLHADGAR